MEVRTAEKAKSKAAGAERDNPDAAGVEAAEMAHVVLADGDESMRRSVARILRAAGHVVDAVALGAEALDRLAAHRVDVLVVSDELGTAEALELLARARHGHPSVMRVLLHAPTMVEGPRAVAAGLAHRALRRPFQAEQLEAEIRSLEETVAHVRHAVSLAGDVEAHGRLFQECVDGELLSLAIQPIVRVGSRTPVAAELLLRSTHAELAGPLSVLDAVERCHRVLDLGAVVNRLAARWMERLPAGLSVFVNTHPAQFADRHAVESFAAIEPWADRVVLEITERAPIVDFEGAEAALQELTRRGFRIAVDDIGSGYNSLSVLAELNPAFIKADMSIVRNVDREPRKQRLLQLLANFAGATSAELIAEGVETAEELVAAERCGAHYLQGYFLGRPTPEWSPLAVDG